MKTPTLLQVLLTGFALAFAGTGSSAVAADAHPPSHSQVSAATVLDPPMAQADLEPTQGNHVHGSVQFLREPEGVRVVVQLSGLTPGEHGIHIHEKGDCSAPDASSAGGHFNPTHRPHGAREEVEQRHVGDLGNITAGPDGRARLNYVDVHLSLTGPNSIVGRAVIVHANPDDLVSQPAGNSGPRVACGVIQAAP